MKNSRLHIAIIDDDEDFISQFRKMFTGVGVKISGYTNAKQIFNDVFKEYDMVYVDYHLGWTTGDLLIAELSKHTNADFALISGSTDHFTLENQKNDKITATIHKNDSVEIMDWYVKIKDKRRFLSE